MAKFLTSLHIDLVGDRDSVWVLTSPLVFVSDIVGRVTAPTGFNTDLASVPRVPIIFALWGGRAHYEGVIHDYLFRKDSDPVVPWATANAVFLEAMKLRGKSWFIRYPMYWGVCMGSYGCYHKRMVADVLWEGSYVEFAEGI